MVVLPFTNKFALIPTPPLTNNVPVDVVVASVPLKMVVFPYMVVFPFTNKFALIPTPPLTNKVPVDVVVDSVPLNIVVFP
jgi:hypothetical protein